MGKTINVSSLEELESASKKMGELSTSYRDISKQLMQIATVMGSSWDGADNLAFTQRISGLTGDLDYMADKLNESSVLIGTIHKNYMDRQQDNIQKVNQLAN